MAEITLTTDEMREIFSAADCRGVVALIDHLQFEKASGTTDTKRVVFDCDPRDRARFLRLSELPRKNNGFALGGSNRTPLEDLVAIARDIAEISPQNLRVFDRACGAFAQALADIEPEAGHG